MIVFTGSWFGRLACVLGLVFAAMGAFAAPVVFRFEVPPNPAEANPFARELWAEVTTPAGRTLLLPAYAESANQFVVHARPDASGNYRLGAVSETVAGTRVAVAARAVTPTNVVVQSPEAMPAVTRDPHSPTRFLRTDGRPLIPLGANVAWPENGAPCVPFYRDAFAQFSGAELNWMRIWMSHWGHLNLDWHSDKESPSPAPGTIDPAVAARWDELLEFAEQGRVYVQMVLQHHGQYSTKVNSNWAANPWNAANPGGFLHSPDEFFTSPTARRLTKIKYRYIAARWGWSPAIFAWELFNEVHWVDLMATPEGQAKVGAWHSEMADWLRSVDAYGHLVTTSTEDLRSPCYAKMDYYQPHLYPADLILGARRIALPGPVADRPVFYGEQGDDHLDVSDAVKASGRALVPAVWAGLFGQARLPAQPWLGAMILQQHRVAELGAVGRFVAGTRFAEQTDLQPFSAVVESDERVPLVLVGSLMWQRRADPEITVPDDGRMPVELADVPRNYAAPSPGERFPTKGTYHIELRQPATLRAQIRRVSEGEPKIRFLVDGVVIAEREWKGATVRPTAAQPQWVELPVSAGRHTLVVQNIGRNAWMEVPAIELGTKVSVLSAVGQRGANLIALWVWNRPELYAESPHAVSGIVVIEDVPAGEWQVTWWDTMTGQPLGPRVAVKGGGTVRLATPPIARHAAVSLSR